MAALAGLAPQTIHACPPRGDTNEGCDANDPFGRLGNARAATAAREQAAAGWTG
jgi:hypothetical protein